MTDKAVAVTVVVVSLASALAATRALGSGFALNAGSPRLMSMAFGGQAALAEDATTTFYNAAGLTRIKQGSFVGVSNGYLIDLDFQGTSSTVYGRPVSGSLDVSPGRDAWVPAFHAAYRLHPDWVVGLSVTAPFGSEVNYGQDSAVRFLATSSTLISYNINPSIAYRINEQWSVGAGFNAMFFQAKLGQKVFVPFPIGPNREGSLFVKLQDWGWGANCGVLWEPMPEARIGLAYRSQITFDMQGPVHVANVPNAQTGKLIGNGEAFATVTTPDSVDLGAVYEIQPGLTLLGNVEWTHWEVFQDLVGTFNNGLPTFRTVENWDDTWSFGLGVAWRMTDTWTLRGGWGFDQSPVTDAKRTVRLPDSNRWLISAGVSYQFLQSLAIDLGYLHAFLDGGSIREVDEQPGNATIVGDYSAAADVIGLQITYNFDHLFEGWDQLTERFGM